MARLRSGGDSRGKWSSVEEGVSVTSDYYNGDW